MKKYEVPTIIEIKIIEATQEDRDNRLVHQIAEIEALVQPSDAWDVQTIQEILTQDIYQCWAVINEHEKSNNTTATPIIAYDTLNKGKSNNDFDIIAYCIWSEVFEVVEILRIGTHPNYQRQGLAYGLIKALQKYTAQKDVPHPIDKVLLEVREDNIAAITLYKKMGFKIIHRRRDYYKSRNDYKSHDNHTPYEENDKVSNKKQDATKSIEGTCDALILQYIDPNT